MVESLKRQISRLEEENRQLRELIDVSPAEQPKVVDGKLEEAGHFVFPKADLPFPLDALRLVPPSQSERFRQAEGDWISLFRNAAPYIASFRGGCVVVHLPSFILEDDMRDTFRGLMEDVAFCSLLGLQMVLVTSIEGRLWRRLRESEMPPSDGLGVKVGNGLKGIVMDEEAMRCAKQEAGFARVEVESAVTAGFEKRNLSNKGLGSASAGLFSVRGAVSVISSTNFFTASPMGVRDGVDFMYAGVVRSVNSDLLQRQLQEGGIVSMTPLGSSPGGEVFYVSSEELAAKVASNLGAIKLVYITKGQCLVDTRQSRIIAGMQAHDARALLQMLESGEGLTSAEERSSDWFCDFVRSLRLLVGSVSPKGVRRGHLVHAFPGSLLQEFYTTDGSGTCVAQDVYQGLGCAALADAASILELLAADGHELQLEAVEASCAAGEFFVWRRDEVVLGCGQLVAHVSEGLVAELRHLSCAQGTFVPNAPALFAYAERAAALKGARLLAVTEVQDTERIEWFAQRGFADPAAEDALPGPLQVPGVAVKRLGAKSGEEAEAAIAAYAEEQRMWGGMD
ncbi:unnamed protein product [Effrenium voratum]|nr:unnamed protein product [Effrenium voratum]